MTDSIRDVLHHVAGLLQWPVLAGLLGLAAAMIVAIGALGREALDRARGGQRRFAQAEHELFAAAEEAPRETLDLELEEALQAIERRWARTVGLLKRAVRVGPSLGLMGTLIPMADALQGLATGNLPALAGNMVTAFAATVVGLAISIAAYLMAAVREEWIRTDLATLAFEAESLSRSHGSRAERKAS